MVRENPCCVKSYSAIELDSARFAIEYLVEGLLVAGQAAVIAGPRKSLKTSLSLDLAIALATGGRFLGRFMVTRPTRVGFMSGESGMATLQETARRIAASQGTALPAVGDALHVSPWLPRFERPADLDALVDWVRLNRLEVVIVDPAYLCLPGESASNSFLMGPLLRAAVDAIEPSGGTLALVHHTRKTPGGPEHQRRRFAPLELDDMAWAGFQEWVRQWLILSRRESYVPGTGAHRLWLNAGGSAGHSGLWGLDVDEGQYQPGRAREWRVQVRTDAELQRDRDDRRAEAHAANVERRLAEDSEKVRSALIASPKGDTEKVVRSRAGLPADRFRNALATLIESGTVVATTVRKANNQAYQAIRLAGPVEQAA